MKSLKHFNQERAEVYKKPEDPHFNGIECPLCGAELVDSNLEMVLLSYPPQKNIHCLKCEYKGYRIA